MQTCEGARSVREFAGRAEVKAALPSVMKRWRSCIAPIIVSVTYVALVGKGVLLVLKQWRVSEVVWRRKGETI